MASATDLLARVNEIGGLGADAGLATYTTGGEPQGMNWRFQVPPLSQFSTAFVTSGGAAALQAQAVAWNAELDSLVILLRAATGADIGGLTPLAPMWGQAGKNVPTGYTVNYGNLFQLWLQAKGVPDIALANSIAAQINAITAAGPIAGGVPAQLEVPAGVVWSPEQLADLAVQNAIAAGGSITAPQIQGATLAPSLVVVDGSSAYAPAVQVFTGGEPQPGGGGDMSGPLDLNATVAQTAAPGSQLPPPADAAPAGAPAGTAPKGATWLVPLAALAVLLGLAWWLRGRSA